MSVANQPASLPYANNLLVIVKLMHDFLYTRNTVCLQASMQVLSICDLE